MIRGVNLIPEDIQHGWRMARVRAALTVVAVIYIAGLALAFYGQWNVISRKKTELKRLEEQKLSLVGSSTQFSELQTRFKDIQQTETDLKRRLDVATGLAQKRISWSLILKWLSRNTPKDVWLKSVSTSDDQTSHAKKVRLLGTSITNEEIAEFMFTIENSGYFQDTALSYSQKRDIDKTTVYDFEISANLRKTGEVMYEW